MTRYHNGARRENAIRKKAMSQGAGYSIRSAGSHGVCDVVMFRRYSNAKLTVEHEDGVYSAVLARFVQSKKGGYVSQDEISKIRTLEKTLGVSVEVL
ncbi:MAG: hypothetical protein KGH62_01480 [Candidatus Micrarchaeota archaeon]|nr:hypothetical protein [Candidatus Micrarchaeota archaeon]